MRHHDAHRNSFVTHAAGPLHASGGPPRAPNAAQPAPEAAPGPALPSSAPSGHRQACCLCGPPAAARPPNALPFSLRTRTRPPAGPGGGPSATLPRPQEQQLPHEEPLQHEPLQQAQEQQEPHYDPLGLVTTEEEWVAPSAPELVELLRLEALASVPRPFTPSAEEVLDILEWEAEEVLALAPPTGPVEVGQRWMCCLVGFQGGLCVAWAWWCGGGCVTGEQLLHSSGQLPWLPLSCWGYVVCLAVQSVCRALRASRPRLPQAGTAPLSMASSSDPAPPPPLPFRPGADVPQWPRRHDHLLPAGHGACQPGVGARCWRAHPGCAARGGHGGALPGAVADAGSAGGAAGGCFWFAGRGHK